MSAFFPKSVKSVASKICHIFTTTIGRALIFVVNDRYKVALAISLSLKASSIFPDREFRPKNGPKSEFLGKSEKIRKFCKNCHFLSFNVFQT